MIQETQQETSQLITRDTTVGDAVQKYPQVASVFQSYGLHCVGCGAAYWETVGDGAAGHGMDDETIDQMIRDANVIAQESLKEKPATGETVHLTQAAADKIKEFMKREHKEQGFLRLGVIGGGCAGQSYDLALETVSKEDDTIITSCGIRVLIDKELLTQLEGISIDYVDSLQGSGFKISNPNAKNSCGCGKSFT